MNGVKILICFIFLLFLVLWRSWRDVHSTYDIYPGYFPFHILDCDVGFPEVRCFFFIVVFVFFLLLFCYCCWRIFLQSKYSWLLIKLEPSKGFEVLQIIINRISAKEDLEIHPAIYHCDGVLIADVMDNWFLSPYFYIYMYKSAFEKDNVHWFIYHVFPLLLSNLQDSTDSFALHFGILSSHAHNTVQCSS